MITVLLYISSEVDLLLSCILDIITILHYYTFIYIHKRKYFMEVFCNQSYGHFKLSGEFSDFKSPNEEY